MSASTNQFASNGSMTALSLAANPLMLPVLITAAGVSVTIAAAYFTYKAYRNYEEKKHKDEMLLVNKYHKEFLEKIIIPGNNEIKGFPVIFKFNEKDKEQTTVESMHFTQEEVDAIGESIPRTSDITLTRYRYSVSCIIKKLKEYYNFREDKNDVTCGVLSYLLYIFETKCLAFEGYEYDIAYLNALSKFINFYAGLENSQHFSRLAPVFRHIQEAKQALERHKESLSLEQMLLELRDTCIIKGEGLIKTFVQMVIKNDYWEYIRTVTMDELSANLVRGEYIRSEIKGIVLRENSAITLPDCILSDWIVILANYYLRALDSDTDLKSDEIKAPSSLFVYKLSDLKEIRDVFQSSKNFITTKFDTSVKGPIPKYTGIVGDDEITSRMRVLTTYATLIHAVISLQHLTACLIKSIKQLGELYIKNPRHYRMVFKVLSDLCDQVVSRIELIQNAIVNIQISNNNAMQHAEKGLFLDEVNALLLSTSTIVSRLARQVFDFRDKVAKHADKNEPTKQSVKQEMFEVANLFSTIYGSKSPVTSNNLSVTTVTTTANPSPQLVLSIEKSDAIFEPVTAQLKNVHRLLDTIQEQVIHIKEHDRPTDQTSLSMQQFHDEIAVYEGLYRLFSAVANKIKKILASSHSAHSEDKQKEKELFLSIDLCEGLLMKIKNFLLLEKNERVRHVKDFSKSIHDDITRVQLMASEPRHHADIDKLMSSVWRSGLFKKGSLERLVSVKDECDKLVGCLTPSSESHE